MGKRGRRIPEPAQVAGLEDGDVEIVVNRRQGEPGVAFYRPANRPRSWDRMGEEGQMILAGVQRLVGQMSQIEGHLEEHVVELRELGASWDLIGWSLGLTGEGARRRFGEVDG